MKSTFALLIVFSIALTFVCIDVSGALATEDPNNYYGLLGSTQAEIGRQPSILKKSYRKLALQHHPDKSTSDEDKATKQAFFVKLSQAYEILSEPRTKARYDYLLSQGQIEYDASRNWDDFDVSQGFKRLPKTAAQKAAANDRKAQEAKYREAQEVFRKAAEEAEEFAIWTALSLAFGIALLPAIYMYFSRKAAAIEEEKKRKERSSDLKANQTALLQLQEEQEAARKAAQEEERQYARELKAAREEAAREAAASSSGAPSDEGSWEVVDGASAAEAGEKDAGEEVESESDDENDGPSKTIIKCQLCKKSFKSQKQMDNHEQSNQHKNALKNAAKDAKKRSRRDE